MCPFDAISFSFIKKLFKKLSEHREKIPIDHPDNSITDEKIANVSRSKITDLWTSPFWSKIPDKPFSTLGSEFKVTNGRLEIASFSRSKITDFFSSPFWDNIPDKPSQYPPEPHTHTRSEITDFWNSPFWENIPDKPVEKLGSEFSVVNNELRIASITRNKISDLWASPFWNNIPDKPFEGLGTEFTVDTNKNLIINQIDFSKITNRKISLIDVDSDFVPNVDNAFSIGKPTAKWKEIHIGSEIYLRGLRVMVIKVISQGYPGPIRSDVGIWVNGVRITRGGRSYTVMVIDRATHNIETVKTYDVYGGIANADAMADFLNSLDQSKIVVIQTFDEPRNNRFGTNNKLLNAMLRCGASREIFGSPNFPFRGAYILVGIPGQKEGNGFEFLSPIGDSADAWVEASFLVVDGHILGGGSTGKNQATIIGGGATNGDLTSLKINGIELLDSNRNVKNVDTITVETVNATDIHATNVYASSLVRVGDLEFRNGWRIVEDPKYGLVLVSPFGKKYKFKLEEVGE